MSSARTLSKILEMDVAMVELQRRRNELLAKQSERLGRLAVLAGLGDLNLSDDDCKALFKDARDFARLARESRTKAGLASSLLPGAPHPVPVRRCSPNPFRKVDKAIALLQWKRAILKSRHRRQDTREKCALGGLAVKAGLRDADLSFVLGALIAASRLNSSDPRWRELRSVGGAVFSEVTEALSQRYAPEEHGKAVREMIVFGGLIIKAGLRDADRAFILGALISASRQKPNEQRWHEFRALGSAASNEAAKPSDQGKSIDGTDARQ